MNIKDILTEEELTRVTRRSNWLGARLLMVDWAVIIGAFTLAGLYPNPLTILLAIFLIGARQLGLGVVVHECGHRTLFSSTSLNNFAGNWLAGYWVFSNKETYMRGHLKHHQFAGTEDDPDLMNYKNYPVSRTSLRRKIIRDLTGQVGWKRIKSIYKAIKNFQALDEQNQQYLSRSLGVNLLMLLVLTAFGAPWLYLIWVIAFMTSHMLVTRIRQIGEHAAVPDNFSDDARLNTRTMYINPLERLFIAPHNVCFHLEHHMLASVPIYRLREMHKLLLQKGYYDEVDFPRGYMGLLRDVTYAS